MYLIIANYRIGKSFYSWVVNEFSYYEAEQKFHFYKKILETGLVDSYKLLIINLKTNQIAQSETVGDHNV